MNTSDKFIDRLYTTAVSPMPKEVAEEARHCLLDNLGAMIGGSSLLKDKTDRLLAGQPSCDGATVIHTGHRASLQNAAMVNGMHTHVFDIDDGNRLTSVHLGAVIIPAVMAVCEYRELSVERLLIGMVVGYEAANRVAKCIQPAHRNRGFHASGTCGEIGAAMGVAAALGFDKDMMKSALGAACTSAAGILEMQENVSTMKPYNLGRLRTESAQRFLQRQASKAPRTRSWASSDS